MNYQNQRTNIYIVSPNLQRWNFINSNESIFYGLWIFSLHWKALHKQITEEFTHFLVLFVWFHFLHIDPGSIWNLFLCVPSGIDLIFSLSKWQNQTSQQNLFNSYSFLKSFEMATSSHHDEIGSCTCVFIYFWNSILFVYLFILHTVLIIEFLQCALMS